MQTIRLVEKIRQEVPGIFLRTTLMTGHPGETEKDFEELCEFVSRMKFERLGVFPYSHEEDTYCDLHYEDNVPEEIKRQRAEKIMELQAGVSEKLNNSLIGKVFKVLVDRKEDNYYIGRTEHDSPEVDPEVIINDSSLSPGQFVNVRITEAFPFELVGETVR